MIERMILQMKRKKFVVGSIVASLLIVGGASAGTSWESFDGTVPGFNGNWSTAYQTKSTTGALAGLQLNSTGGETLDVRTEGTYNGSWTRSVTGGNTYQLDSSNTSGQNEKLKFSTDLFDGNTPITGNWRSN